MFVEYAAPDGAGDFVMVGFYKDAAPSGAGTGYNRARARINQNSGFNLVLIASALTALRRLYKTLPLPVCPGRSI
jgi:hypothetical protein